MKREYIVSPIVDMKVHDAGGRLVLTVDGLEEVARNYPQVRMSANEKKAWQKRLKLFADNNEYYNSL